MVGGGGVVVRMGVGWKEGEWVVVVMELEGKVGVGVCVWEGMAEGGCGRWRW